LRCWAGGITNAAAVRDLAIFSLVTFSAVFFVVDPIAVVPAFLAMTVRDAQAEKRATARRAAVASGVTLAVFAAAGQLIFRMFGISLGAFRIAGGVLLFLLALEMMQAKPSRTKSTPEEQREGIEKDDVAIIPLAIPLLSGPGAIATVMVLIAQARSPVHVAIVFASIAATAIATWVLLRGSTWIEGRVSRTFMNIVTRVMGLILAAVAVQFLVSGVRDVLPQLRA
jgi:multiple antibiotic resistance protein